MISLKNTPISLALITILFCIPIICTSNDDSKTINKYIPGSCTIFFITHGESVFFGNNEDWKNPLTYYWIMPPDPENYGVLCFGFDNLYPQGGINEKGLAFDANSLPRIPVKKNQEGIKPYHAIVNTLIMQKCATVREAIEMAKSYDWSRCYGGELDGQFLLADALGDAVVISADSDGEIVFTREPDGVNYLVSTNFNRTNPDNRYGKYPCDRYQKTVKMLSGIKSESDLTVDFLASILEEVHQEGKRINTLYSNIFDLKNGVAYLYYWHQFNYTVTLDVAELIALQPPPAQIKTLFPEEIIDQAAKEYNYYKKRPFIGFALAVIIFFALIIIRRVRRIPRRNPCPPQP